MELPSSEDFDLFAEEILGEQAMRPLIIVAAARIDTLLLGLLTTYLLPKRAKARDNDELLEGDRPLSAFSARIKLAYRLGLIDSSLYQALEMLRALRNPGAHHVTFDLSRSPLREHLASLRTAVVKRKSYDLTRKRYFGAEQLSALQELQCILLTLCVLIELIHRSAKRTAGVTTLLSISGR